MKASRFFLISSTALAVAVAGCRTRQQDGASTAGNSMSSESLQVTLTTDKTAYRPGEPIGLALTLINRSSRDTSLEFSSGQRYDFQIADRSGETLWTWSSDRTFMQMLGSEPLKAGETREYREQFTDHLPPGTYQVTGFVTVMAASLRASTSITVR